MISFGEANLGHKEVRPVSAELIAAMQLAQKPIYTIRNRPNKQAMACVNGMGGGNANLHPVIMKNGGTSGFGDVMAINPTKDAPIFIGMNRVGADPAEKGVEICGASRSSRISVRETPGLGFRAAFFCFVCC